MSDQKWYYPLQETASSALNRMYPGALFISCDYQIIIDEKVLEKYTLVDKEKQRKEVLVTFFKNSIKTLITIHELEIKFTK